MSAQPVLEIVVTIHPEDYTSFATANGKVTFLPFSGEATGLITGAVRPGGVCIKIFDLDEEGAPTC